MAWADIQTLPASFPSMPLFWSAAELAALGGTNLQLERATLDQELTQLLADLHPPDGPLCPLLRGNGGWCGGDELKELLGGDVCSGAALRWAW